MTANTIKPGSFYRMLKRNMVLTVALVSLVPLVITGGLILNQFQEAYRAKMVEHLEALAQKHRRNIDNYLADRLAEIRVLTRSYTVAELGNPQSLRDKLLLLREEYGGAFVDLGLVDSDGLQISYAGPFNLQMADYANSTWFKGAMASEHYISDVFTGLRGAPHFIVAVKKNCEDRCYIVRATIDFEAFNALVENIQLGETGFAFILNRKGQFQTQPRIKVDVDRGPYREILDSRLNPKGTTIVERPDALGHPSIFAVAPLQYADWYLFIQQRQDDAFSHLRHTERLALVLIAVSALIVLVVAWVLSRRMVNLVSEADQQTEQINEKMVEAGRLASIGELAAGIAHEINNPVAIMVEEAGWVQDLLDDDDPASDANLTEIRRAVAQIRTQGSRCKEITHKLLSFARKTDPKVSQLQLNEMVEDVLGVTVQKARYANVKIETVLQPDLPPVSGSASEMQQVILNLVNNAVDAMEGDGGRIDIATSQENGKVLLTVTDTGKGIAESNLARIFDPFYTTKPVGQGTGLGLSICYGIVHKLGGDIKVRSQKGHGTTFTIYLPANETAAGGQENSTNARAPQGGAGEISEDRNG